MRLSRLSIKYKILLIVVLGITLLTAGTIFRIREVAVEEAKNTAAVKAAADLAFGYQVVDLKYPGAWHLENGQLYKGETLINDNNQLVDNISQLAKGDIVTIFADRKRVATTVIENGRRAVGTNVDQNVAEVVLKTGEIFNGEADILGALYQTAYQPIRNSNGEIIGIWSVATSLGFVQQLISGITINTAIFSLIATIILIIILLFFVVRLIRPLNDLSQYAEEIAAGNLNLTIAEAYLKKEDEIGTLAAAFQKMLIKLRTVITEITTTVEELGNSSQDLTATGEELSASADEVGNSIQHIASGAEEQSAQVQEVTSLIDTLAEDIDKISANSQEMGKQSQNVVENIKSGNQALTNSKQSFQQVSENTRATSAVIDSLGQSSEKIGQIVNLINDIASQTNLLALNAAIEAARAGEAGRGFSVVADEIRTLAEQAAKATEDISRLIISIQKDVKNTVSKMNQNEVEVDNSVAEINRTADVFVDVTRAADSLSQLISAIERESISMNQNSETARSAVGEIAVVSEEAAHNAEGVAAASIEQSHSTRIIAESAEALVETAGNLADLVRQFKLN
ncbi:methyl-accepting chemotaxis protein [Halanaerobium salsuginis]|uniref:Methyl-accepting chemotaxis protein n=1 Tax=Halanaerobium salsuginis TaxID=29563 RepID=A0A1I4FXY4_9FIRM|nr:methyl-accepting chemotaxis protein [Halanaerobium salsuginis]SFL22080.1 methyl-accepting chemotaxis protein [Halanaerobium salsuginis]